MYNRNISQMQNDTLSFLSEFINNKINKIWTCVVAEIVDYNLQERTVSVQPLISEVFVNESSEAEIVEIPILKDVPLIYLYGGLFEMTFPIKEKDECLVFFSKQCIDNWWYGGGKQNPFELRKFDISDGFALVGVFSQKVIQNNKLLEPIENGMMIRQIDDTISLQINEENLSFFTKTADDDKKIISELILDKNGNYTYNIYNDDDLLIENKYTENSEVIINTFDGSDPVNAFQMTNDSVSLVIKDDKLKLELTEASIDLNIQDKLKISGSDSEYSLNIQDKVTITVSDSSVDIDTGQATISISDSVTVEQGSNKVEIGSSGIVLDTGASKIEIGSSGVSINGGALSVLP